MKRDKRDKKSGIIKYIVAVPFLSNSYLFSINKKIGWSIIDYLFLKELNTGDITLNELSEKSNIKKQIVLQIILPMCDVGWIDIITTDTDFSLTITENGKKAYIFNKKNHELPCQTTEYSSKREIHVDSLNNYYNFYKSEIQLMQYARYQEVKSKENLEVVELPLSTDSVYPDYDRMCEIAGHSNEDVVKADDLNIALLDSKSFLLVEVLYTPDNQSKIIKNSLYSLLHKKLVQQIESTLPSGVVRSQDNIAIMTDINRKNSGTTIVVQKDNVDFVYGGAETESKFLELIKSSKNFLIIHSTFIGTWCIRSKDEQVVQYTEYFQAIKEALRREVSVYVLWGKTNLESHEEGFDKSHEEDERVKGILDEFNESCRRDGIVDLVDFNDFRRTESHAKFIITEHEDRGACVMVSSCNFLYTQFIRFEASLVVYDDHFVKPFLEIAANICIGKNKISTSVRKEILNYSSQIASSMKSSSSSIPAECSDEDKLTVSLILKNQHYYYIDNACNKAQKQIFITSDLINSTPKRPIYDALKHSTAKKYLFYSNRASYIKQPEIDETRVNLDALENPIRLRQSPHRKKHHAKVLAWDKDDILITSLNWLSSNASVSHGEEYHEVGVHIHGHDVATKFIDEFNSCT